jgi:lipopolysaccharide biosynthesis glycosyltransferase
MDSTQVPKHITTSNKENIDPNALTKNAWVVLLMGDPHYIIGALTMVHSLRLTNTKYDIVCITPDANQQNINYLQNYFNEIYRVELLEYPSTSFTTQNQNVVYRSQVNKSYTKWTALSLIEYKKVCIIDTDLIVVNNMDHIFDLQTPVGVFSNHLFDRNKPDNQNNNTCNYYMDIKPGDSISPGLINKALHLNGFVLSAHLTVLDTSVTEYLEFKECMKTLTKYTSFGFNNSSSHDEQSICYFQSFIKNRNWTCLKYPYNTIPWKLKQSISYNSIYQPPHLIHFNMNPKPWCDPTAQSPDTDIWWAYAHDTPNMDNIFKIWGRSMRQPIDNDCSFCIIVENQLKQIAICPPHTILMCPILRCI